MPGFACSCVVGLCTKPSICILKASEGDGFSFQCECAASLLRRPILASERGASRKRERERAREEEGVSLGTRKEQFATDIFIFPLPTLRLSFLPPLSLSLPPSRCTHPTDRPFSIPALPTPFQFVCRRRERGGAVTAISRRSPSTSENETIVILRVLLLAARKWRESHCLHFLSLNK